MLEQRMSPVNRIMDGVSSNNIKTSSAAIAMNQKGVGKKSEDKISHGRQRVTTETGQGNFSNSSLKAIN